MTPKSELIALAELIKGQGYVSCPLCGESDFDAPGFVSHINQWCEVADAALLAKSNVETASILRARLEAL